MSGFNNMNVWEKEFSPHRDHIDDQLLKDEPDADTWHWGILPQDDESAQNPIKQDIGSTPDTIINKSIKN